MLRSAEVMHLAARRAAEFGVEIDGKVRFRLDRAIERKNQIVRGIHSSIYRSLESQSRISFLRGEARFVSQHEIDTGERRLSFAKAIVATGARRSEPAIAGLQAIGALDNDTALHLERLPERLVVIGAGYVGLEFAQMYARFGSRVTLVGRNRQLAPGEDAELADLLADYLHEEGIDLRTSAEVESVRAEGANTVVQIRSENELIETRADAILVATGRVGNTDALGLGEAGLVAQRHGFLAVDDELRTEQPHLWAIGDVKGGRMFTHVATYDGPIAALNAMRGAGRKVDYRVVPSAIFTDPTLASVGWTEEEARRRGREIKVGTVEAEGARAMAIGDRRGRLKAVVDADGGEILGFHVLAPHGDDLLHEAVAAMYEHGTIDRIARSIHVHPTLSEMMKAAARAAR